MTSELYSAAILRTQNQELQLELIDVKNRSVDKGEVKVRLITSGLCGAQVNEIRGIKGPDRFLPHFMGHEGYGVVDSVGAGVSKVKAGDEVILHWRPASGLSIAGVRCQSSDGENIGGGPVTTFSEYTFVAENRVTKIHDTDESLKHVYPLLGCAIPTAYGALKNEAKITNEDRILIVGAGGIGTALLFWCKKFLAQSIDVIDLNEQKREQVEAFGASFFTDFGGLSDKSYTVILESTGVSKNIENVFDVADKLARIILIGQTKKDESLTFKNFLRFYDGMQIIASQGGLFDPDRDLQDLLAVVNEDKDLALQLISDVICLADINHGFQLMGSGPTRRVIIDFDR